MAYAQYRSLIIAAERKYGLPHGLLAGLLDEESGIGNVGCNSSGACGIAQIVPYYHSLTQAQALDPAVAIPAAASIVAGNIAQCGSVAGALRRYFSGRCNPPATITDANGTTPAAYVAAVLARAKGYGYGEPFTGTIPATTTGSAPPPSSPAAGTSVGAPAPSVFPVVIAGIAALLLVGFGVREVQRGV